MRNELLEHDTDPTYDELANGLPYLDAVIHEILRLHPPVGETARIVCLPVIRFGSCSDIPPTQAIEDDVIPLSEPIRTKSGQRIENLSVAKGTVFTVPMASVNRSAHFWGEDAKVFRPGRWLEDDQNGIPTKAKEIQGYRHLLTFVDGPRICLGRTFVVAEFKVRVYFFPLPFLVPRRGSFSQQAVLSVLVKNFVFELRDGMETKIEVGSGFLPRPQVAGEVGCKVPLRTKPYVG